MQWREHQENSPMNPRPVATELAGRQHSPPIVLRGRRLFVARAAWVILATLTLGLFVASLPIAYARYDTVCEATRCDFVQLSPAGAMALEQLGLSVDFYAAYNLALDIIFALGYWAIGVILFWKRSNDLLVLCASIAFVTFGTIQPDTLDALVEAYPRWDLPVAYVYFVGNVSFFVLFCVFPDGRFVPTWTRWAAAVWVVYQLLYSFLPDAPFSPRHWPLLIDISLFLGLIGSLVVAQVYRYRRASTQEQRQQTKWVVFGFTAAIAVLIGVSLIGWIFTLTQLGIPQVFYDMVGATAISLSALLIPLSISFAIRRYRLWDIDLIIKHSIVYGSLSAVLTTVFVITDTVLLPLVVRSVLGVEAPSLTITVVSGVIIAVLFKPLRSRIEAGVKRLSDRLAGGTSRSEAPR
jgi:hypothetical protein